MPTDNLDLSTIPGSGPNTKKTQAELSDAISKATEAVTQVVDGGASGEKKFTLPEGYNPMLAPEVKALRDTLLSQQASLKSELAKKDEALASLTTKVDSIAAEKDAATTSKMTEIEKLGATVKQLAEQNKELIGKFVESENARAAEAFTNAKTKVLTEFNISPEWHKHVGVGAQDIESFKNEAQEFAAKIATLVPKSKVDAAMTTKVTGASAPPSKETLSANAAPAGFKGGIVSQLTEEQAKAVNLDTLTQIVKSSPKLANTLKRALNIK